MQKYDSEYQNSSADFSIMENNSDISVDDDKRFARHIKHYYRDSIQTEFGNTPIDNQANTGNTDGLSCKICFNKSGRKDNYIVLSCNHVFHIQCLVENHFNDTNKYPVIDAEYFSTRKCQICSKQLETEELMFLHSKFHSSAKDKLESHQTSIVAIEERLKKLKEELRTCYEYKNKLEHDRETSKQIISTLMTMF